MALRSQGVDEPYRKELEDRMFAARQTFISTREAKKIQLKDVK